MTIPMCLLHWEKFWSGAIWKIVEVWDNLDESQAEILIFLGSCCDKYAFVFVSCDPYFSQKFLFLVHSNFVQEHNKLLISSKF